MKLFLRNMLLLSLLPLNILAANADVAQANLVAKYFAKGLNTSIKNIEVELVHSSKIDLSLLKSGHIQVQSGSRKMNLGHQTLWLVHKVNGVVKRRYPVTVEVYANIEVPTAARNINRLETLSADMIAMKSIRMGREYQRTILDVSRIQEKMATQIIREGRTFERNMIRNRPDVLLGDDVQIILQDEGLKLELPGIVKEEGQIGEEIRVQCPTTRKEFRGILESLNEVVVSLR